jgi:hypothetical protein
MISTSDFVTEITQRFRRFSHSITIQTHLVVALR